MNNHDKCPLFEVEDAMLNLKKNKGKELFSVIVIYGIIYTVLNLMSGILLIFVKDSSKYGLKFECLSVSIMIFIFNIINIILQRKCSISSFFESIEKYNKLPRRGYMDIFEKTKVGKILFSFVSIYMFFISITLPIIQYYKAKSIRNYNDSLGSIQYFYEVLNTPSLVKELSNIAVKEFSVENVLFWENYQILQKMVIHYNTEYQKAKEMDDEQVLNQYDFENYYQQQLQQSFSFDTNF